MNPSEPTGQQPEALPNVSYTVLAQEYQKAWEIIDENDRLIADKDKRIAELEALLRETIYKFEDGQWFPDDLYNKIWNTIRDTNGKA